MKRTIISLLLMLVLCLSLAAGASAENDLLVWDDAGLLSEAEVTTLNARLETISQKYNAEVRVVTIPSLAGGNVDTYLNTLYDTSGFGYGENHDGVLMLVCMNPREYRILSNGFASAAISGSEIDIIGEALVSDLSYGYYVDAFKIFADECEYYLNGYINGFPFDVLTSTLTAGGIGVLAAVVVTTVLKSQLRSVRRRNEANAYVKAGTMQITRSGDYFMYRRVMRTRRQSSSSSGGRSGSSRSTGGGSF